LKEIRPGRQWLKVTVACPEQIVEPVSDLVGVLSGVGVEIKPVSATKTREISGFFAIDADGPGEPAAAVPDHLMDELEKLFALYTLIPSRPTTEIIDDQDWSTSWQRFFTPFEIVPGLVIKPSWVMGKIYPRPGAAGPGNGPGTGVRHGAACFDKTGPVAYCLLFSGK